MVKIKDSGLFAAGLLFLLPVTFLTVLGMQISLINLILLLGGIYLILCSIFEHKQAILSIFLATAILISVFIWLISQNVPLTSKDVLLGIITAIGFYILGIITYLGILPVKVMRPQK